MLLYGLFKSRVETRAPALDLWSTVISNAGLTTPSSARRKKSEADSERGDRILIVS